MYNRYDMDFHLYVLCINKIISETLENDMQESDRKVFE